MKRIEQTLTVGRRYAENGKTVSERTNTEPLEVRTFATEAARVRVGLKRTINLGNFESVSIEVAIEVPCYVEELDAALDYAQQLAEGRVISEAKEIQGYAQKRDSRFL